MRTALILILLAAAGCASDPRNEAERAWQVAECNRILDQKDRERCLRRADDDYGGRRARDEEPARRK
jgi:hypothetical protein